MTRRALLALTVSTLAAACGGTVTRPPTFEPPASRRLFRVTDASDGDLVPRMYSYWPNAVILGDAACVFVGHTDGHPRFFFVALTDGHVVRLGSLLPYTGTAEGWYWTAQGRIYLIDGPRLRRVNPFDTPDDEIVLDISATHPGCDLWQAHSSDDGRIHSATVRRIVSDGAYPKVGTVVSMDGVQQFVAATDPLDESDLSTDGAYLLIKTNDDDNEVITLATGERRTLTKDEGGVGHSAMGASLVVGANRARGTCDLIDLRGPLTAGRPLFASWNVGHLARRGDVLIVSDDTHISRVALDGSGVTPLIAHGGLVDDYDSQVKANLSPDGRLACYMVKDAAGRFDVYLARVT